MEPNGLMVRRVVKVICSVEKREIESVAWDNVVSGYCAVKGVCKNVFMRVDDDVVACPGCGRR